jgi:hypothetical protein
MVENISYDNGTITYKQGTHANIILRISKNDIVSQLDGYSAKLIIQKSYSTATTYCELLAVVEDTPDGDYLNFKFGQTTMASVVLTTDFSDMVYQIKIVDANSNISIPMRGTFRLYKELT